MINLKIDEEERNILLQMLETCISDLRVEISDTDNLDYKDMLKSRKAVLIKLLDAIQVAEQISMT